MTADELQHAIKKALEAWTLQNLCDMAILSCFVILGLVAGRAYLEAIKQRLSLRVASEVWEAFTDLGADLLLLAVALVGLFLTNMDIMADIKIAVPWVPLGFLLLAIALVVRTCHGGSAVGSRAWRTALGLLAAGCLSCWFGFTFVMEAAGKEYLELHPSASAAWTALSNMRSDRNPDLAMATFLWAGPGFLLVFAWGVLAGLARTLRWARGKGADGTESD
jgi:hypothetical protein